MKKFFITMFAGLVMCNMLQAQNEESCNRKVALEIQANPFATNFKMFQLCSDEGQDQYKLRIKRYINEKKAIRLGIGFGLVSAKEGDDDETRNKLNGIASVDVGIEHHFLSSKRFDPYVGGEIGGFYNFIGETYYGRYTTLKYVHRNSDGDIGNYGIKICVLTGFNFFVYKQLYIGTELGLKLSLAYSCDSWIERDGEKEDICKGLESPQYLKFGFYVEPALRLGWLF